MNFFDKFKKRTKSTNQQQKKLIIKKCLDKKTFWSACITLIFGIFMMVFALIISVVGYLNNDYFVTNFVLQNGSSLNKKVNSFSWFAFLFQSLQYFGPISMGIGMFLLIISIVITLEARDRHVQIGMIQEDNNIELIRRSRQSTIKRTRLSERNRANTFTAGDHLKQQNKINENRNSTEEIRNSSKLSIQAEIHLHPSTTKETTKQIISTKSSLNILELIKHPMSECLKREQRSNSLITEVIKEGKEQKYLFIRSKSYFK
ncbi:hypothetical protein Mgra_00000987 [Meloidogyne graminicola]|uniref:Transmembrane protein n=1 Tax=Meloidogyne graminicola TaxID=189291 RepID=A0A8T0A0U8_9BILA|nr:hypothetical protein Mgra_00000987 [Meloidogyne graminicola]